jgi:NifB/MoaA-like Fe-S oxidoreductase
MATKTKKTKVVDLAPKADKITQEELTNLQGLAREFDNHYKEIGVTEARKHNLVHAVAGLQDQMKVMQEHLKTTYGDIDIDITNGEIKYPENGELDKKD